MSKVAKTIYVEKDLIKKIGEGVFTERVNDLIIKGLEYERNGEKINMRKVIEYLLDRYNSNPSNKDKPISII